MTADFVFVDVCITTGGTINSVLARFTGEARQALDQQKTDMADADLIGFVKLSHAELNYIRQQSHDIHTLHQKVRTVVAV